MRTVLTELVVIWVAYVLCRSGVTHQHKQLQDPSIETALKAEKVSNCRRNHLLDGDVNSPESHVGYCYDNCEGTEEAAPRTSTTANN